MALGSVMDLGSILFGLLLIINILDPQIGRDEAGMTTALGLKWVSGTCFVRE